MGILVMIFTFIISVFGFSQVIGSIIYKVLMQKRFEFILTIIIWLGILYGYYLIIINNFNNYFSFYKVATIIAVIVTFLTITNEKN